MVAGTIDIGYIIYRYRIYIYVSGYLLVFFFIHCVPFEPVLDEFF